MASSLVGQPLVLRVTQIRCGLHRHPNVRNTLKAIGLRKINHSLIVKNTRPMRGMLNRVKHFIRVEPIPYKGPDRYPQLVEHQKLHDQRVVEIKKAKETTALLETAYSHSDHVASNMAHEGADRPIKQEE